MRLLTCAAIGTSPYRTHTQHWSKPQQHQLAHEEDSRRSLDEHLTILYLVCHALKLSTPSEAAILYQCLSHTRPDASEKLT